MDDNSTTDLYDLLTYKISRQNTFIFLREKLIINSPPLIGQRVGCTSLASLDIPALEYTASNFI